MSYSQTRDGPVGRGPVCFSGVVDLSHPVHPGNPCWPGDPPVEFEVHSTIETHGYFLRRFSMGEHSATHLTAPASFYEAGATVEAYSPADLVRPAVVIDARNRSASDPDYTLSASGLLQWERAHGPVPSGSLALLLTGWAARWNDPSSYLGLDDSGALHFPGFGIEAAGLLLRERRVAGLGIDTAGVDTGSDRSFAVSKMALERPRLVLENLANLHLLPPFGATVVVGLLRLAGGSGAPAAVTALLP